MNQQKKQQPMLTRRKKMGKINETLISKTKTSPNTKQKKITLAIKKIRLYNSAILSFQKQLQLI